MSADADHRIRELRRRGHSERQIAQLVGVTRHRVRSVLDGVATVVVPAGVPLRDALEAVFAVTRRFAIDDDAALDAAVLCLKLAERVDAGSCGDEAATLRPILEHVAIDLATGWTPETNPLIGIKLRLGLRLLGEPLPEWLEVDA